MLTFVLNELIFAKPSHIAYFIIFYIGSPVFYMDDKIRCLFSGILFTSDTQTKKEKVKKKSID